VPTDLSVTVSIHLRPRGDGGTGASLSRERLRARFNPPPPPRGRRNEEAISSTITWTRFQSTSAPAGTEEPAPELGHPLRYWFQSTSAPAGTEEPEEARRGRLVGRFQSTSAPAGTEERRHRLLCVCRKSCFNPPPPPRGRRNHELVGYVSWGLVSIHLRPRGDGGTQEAASCASTRSWFQSTSAPAGTEEPSHLLDSTPLLCFNPPPPPRGRRNRAGRYDRSRGRPVSIHLRPRGDGGTVRATGRLLNYQWFQSTSAPAGTEEPTPSSCRACGTASFNPPPPPRGRRNAEPRSARFVPLWFQSTSAPAGTEEPAGR